MSSARATSTTLVLARPCRGSRSSAASRNRSRGSVPLPSGSAAARFAVFFISSLSGGFALAVQHLHLPLVIARAGDGARRHRGLDRSEIVLGELDLRGLNGFGEALAILGADQRDDVVPARKRPGDGELGRADAFFLGKGLELLGEGEVV